MYTVNALERGSIVGCVLAIRHSIDSLLSHDHGALRQVVASRGGIAELMGWATATIVMALMVLLAGASIVWADPTPGPASSHAAMAAFEIDPRDSVLNNGPVTPWMERVNSTDHWTSPLLPTPSDL